MIGNIIEGVLPYKFAPDSRKEGANDVLTDLVWDALTGSSDAKHDQLTFSPDTPAGDLLEPVYGSPIRANTHQEVPGTVDLGADMIYRLIGQKCVALGLDLASRILAQSLFGIVQQEIKQQSSGKIASGSSFANEREFVIATWQKALDRGQTTMLEQAIAQALEILPISSQPVASNMQNNIPTPPYPNELTTREVEVLRLLAGGLTNTQLASRLVVSINTVRAHLHSIFGKLDVKTRGAAVRFAIEHNLVV